MDTALLGTIFSGVTMLTVLGVAVRAGVLLQQTKQNGADIVDLKACHKQLAAEVQSHGQQLARHDEKFAHDKHLVEA